MDTFRGSRTLLSFAPRWTDPEILDKTLVGRRDLVDRLEELAIDGAGGPNKHQRLIVGPGGVARPTCSRRCTTGCGATRS